MNAQKKLLIGLTAIVAGLILLRIVVSSAFSVDGIAMARINEEIATLDRENMLLAEKVYTLASLTTVASDAASMGFVEEKSQISLAGTSPLAIKQ